MFLIERKTRCENDDGQRNHKPMAQKTLYYLVASVGSKRGKNPCFKQGSISTEKEERDKTYQY